MLFKVLLTCVILRLVASVDLPPYLQEVGIFGKC